VEVYTAVVSELDIVEVASAVVCGLNVVEVLLFEGL
jgi:hypothetical protein